MKDTALDSLTATLDHHASLADKAEAIRTARLDTEESFCHRFGIAWRAGELTAQEALTLYDRFRAHGVQGYSNRYKAAECPGPNSLRHAIRTGPNGPNGTWHGPSLMDSTSPAPVEGTAVVYVLYDAALTPIYVGSTSNFRARIKAHRRTKTFEYWTAQPCVDREHAYAMEAAAIRHHQPILNAARPSIKSPCRYSETGWCLPSCDVREGCKAHAQHLDQYAQRVTPE